MVLPTSWDGVAIGGNVRAERWERSIATHNADKPLLQFRVLRLGFLQDGDVGIALSEGGQITAAAPSPQQVQVAGPISVSTLTGIPVLRKAAHNHSSNLQLAP